MKKRRKRILCVSYSRLWVDVVLHVAGGQGGTGVYVDRTALGRDDLVCSTPGSAECQSIPGSLHERRGVDLDTCPVAAIRPQTVIHAPEDSIEVCM